MSQNSPQKWFNLEEQFYKGLDQQLINRLKADMEIAESAEAIARVTGITNTHLAEEIAKLKVNVGTLAAFRLVPMVAVAWADDRVEENERYVITKAAEKSGIAKDDPAMELLDSWTRRRPGEELLETWCEYAHALQASLTEVHREALRKEVVEQVQTVAEAAGGILGFGSVSPAEKAIIRKVEAALS